MSTTNRKLPELQPVLQLVSSELISDFPSGSAISYHSGLLYLTGDDATNVRVLDTNYQLVKNIRVFKGTDYRIPKTIKTDPEASEIIDDNGKQALVLLGSGSTNARKRLVMLPISGVDAAKPRFFLTGVLDQTVRKLGVKEVNFEGLALCGDTWIIANRGNNGNPQNHLVFARGRFWNQASKITLSAIDLPGKLFSGVSGLEYGSNDRLYFTASTEESNNSFEDGAIGDSYVGWIDDIHKKAGQKVIKPSMMLKLNDLNPAFKDQKIEGICIQEENAGTCIIHLVADNDKGDTRLFKVKLNFAAKDED